SSILPIRFKRINIDAIPEIAAQPIRTVEIAALRRHDTVLDDIFVGAHQNDLTFASRARIVISGRNVGTCRELDIDIEVSAVVARAFQLDRNAVVEVASYAVRMVTKMFHYRLLIV